MSKSVIFKETKQMINVIKFFCIFSVICAHTNSITENSTIQIQVFSSFLNILGTIGVSIFFIISGFLFFYNKNSFTDFYKKKIKNIVVPWLITGTIVFFYVYIRKGNINISSWLNYILGNGTYLYYMSMLTLNYLIFFKLKNKRLALYLAIILSGLNFLGEYNGLYLISNPYMNILNWIGYFCIGILIAKEDVLDKIVLFSKRWHMIFIIIWFFFILYMIIFENFSYWNKFYVPFELISFIIIVYFSEKYKNVKVLENIGKQTFAIYLLHMLVVGTINYIFVRVKIEYLLLLKPMIVLIIVYTAILFVKYLLKMFHINYTVLFGIR